MWKSTCKILSLAYLEFTYLLLEKKMRLSIANIFGTFNRSFRIKKNRIRCISIQDFTDTDDIELEMEHHSLIIVFFKEFRIKQPMRAKRFLQRLNAFIRQYEYDMLNLGKLDYLFLLPKDCELTTKALSSIVWLFSIYCLSYFFFPKFMYMIIAVDRNRIEDAKNKPWRARFGGFGVGNGGFIYMRPTLNSRGR